MPSHHIQRLVIKNYRGVAFLDTRVADAGAMIKGGNARGKTSVLRAIRAALLGRDVGPDAIHLGESKAEILVDMGDLSVQRAITAKGNTLKVVTAAGDTKAKPQTFLTDLLGTAPLDPLDLYLEKDVKKRRATILGALPVRVTAEQLRGWVSPAVAAVHPLTIPNLDRHGLEVVAEVRKHYYDIRASVNADHKINESRLAEADRRLAKLAPVVPGATLDEATKAQGDLQRKLADAKGAKQRHGEHEQRTAAFRTQVTELRAKAAATRAQADEIPAADRDTLIAQIGAQRELVEAAKEALRNAEASLSLLEESLRESKEAGHRRESLLRDAKSYDDTADTIDQSIAAGAEACPSDADLAELEAALRQSTAMVERATRNDERTAAEIDRELLSKSTRASGDLAGQLSAVVDVLTKRAPSELLAGDGGGIEGLELDEDAILLNGVSMDALSGKEQLRFATEIARRLNAKSRFLIVDGLERLDPEQLEAFVHDATRDGYQLIATKVDAGDVVIEAITTEATEAANEHALRTFGQ